MITIKLDENAAWYLTEILSRSLDNYTMFETTDENDEVTFDGEFHQEIYKFYNELLKARGLR